MGTQQLQMHAHICGKISNLIFRELPFTRSSCGFNAKHDFTHPLSRPNFNKTCVGCYFVGQHAGGHFSLIRSFVNKLIVAVLLSFFLKASLQESSEESSEEDELLLRAELREQQHRALMELELSKVSMKF